MSAVLAAALLAAAAPHAGHMGHDMSAPEPAPNVEAAPADPGCPPEHAAMGHCQPASPPPPDAIPPVAAPSGPEHAADAVWGAAEMARARRIVYAEHGGFGGHRLLLDRFEYAARDGRDRYAWEGDAWVGGDYDRFWVKSEGEGAFGAGLEHGEVQALFSRAIGPWFNLQAGLRQDFGEGPDPTHLALGVQGLAPYWFEIDAAVFVSTKGDLTARLEAEYDQRLTNQLILQPRIELNLAAQDVPERGIGAGLSTATAGLRLRYEFVPEFAPYIGVEYGRSIGRTADFAQVAGERAGQATFVTGIRAWF